MQNFDFYDRSSRNMHPGFERPMAGPDPEYFARMTQAHSKETERNRRRGNRMLFFITALCIISFTTGIIIGLKFAGGSSKEIVDKNTMSVMNDLGKRFQHLMKEQQKQKTSKQQKKKTTASLYPKSVYPFVIQISGFTGDDKKEVATFLSRKGGKKHTIVVTSSNIYILQKNKTNAKELHDKILSYSQYNFDNKLKIIRR